jgi:hypothetical protein
MLKIQVGKILWKRISNCIVQLLNVHLEGGHEPWLLVTKSLHGTGCLG